MSARHRRLGSAYDYADMRALARRALPRGLFDFIDGGSEDGLAARRNRAAFDDMTLLPRPLVDVSARTAATDLFGRTLDFPLAIAPTGAAGLLWYQGEIALARAARRAGVPFTVATASITRLEDVADLAGGNLWFQLYLWPDRSMSYELVRRAQQAGYSALVVTVDTVVAPNRAYNARNGFSIPIRINRRNTIDCACHPHWLLGVIGRYLAKGGMPRQENYPAALRRPVTAGQVGNPKNETVDWGDLAALRAIWRGPLIVKGVMAPDDAVRAMEAGADAVVVSNHGGRNFDSAPASLARLPSVVDAIGGRIPTLFDGGVTRGSDIAKAVALGARAAMIGRAALWGVAAGGEEGVIRMLDILRTDFDRTLAFTGALGPLQLRDACPGSQESDRSS